MQLRSFSAPIKKFLGCSMEKEQHIYANKYKSIKAYTTNFIKLLWLQCYRTHGAGAFVAAGCGVTKCGITISISHWGIVNYSPTSATSACISCSRRRGGGIRTFQLLKTRLYITKQIIHGSMQRKRSILTIQCDKEIC